MMSISKNLIRTSLVAAALAIGLSACGTSHLSRIDSNGQSSDPVWPEIRPGGWMQSGTFPNLQNLRHVYAGMTKDQLMASLGHPHFREGKFGVREWDYIFNFRTGGPNGEYVTCQYKVLFDKDYLAQSFHWRDNKCAQYLDDAKPVTKTVTTVVEKPAPETRKVNLSADALFAFGRSGAGDIVDSGRSEIAALAASIRDSKAASVTVIGHTDEIGSAESNQRLSEARANGVRQLLIENGVDGSIIRAVGAGESQPVKSCDSNAPRAQYIACLLPNRRVEIEMSGVR